MQAAAEPGQRADLLPLLLERRLLLLGLQMEGALKLGQHAGRAAP